MTIKELTQDKSLIEFGDSIVRKAGALLVEMQGQVQFESKKSQWDLVSEADRAAEELVFAACKEKYPEWQVVGEESAATGKLDAPDWNSLCWVLDPLDGTVNYAANMEHFAVSLALLYKGEPIIGWVYSPRINELFFAIKEGGSFLNGKKLSLDNTEVAPTWGCNQPFLPEPYSFAPMEKLLREYGKLRIIGAQTLHLCMVAAGRLSFSFCKAYLWDESAGSLIVKEAGGHYSKLNGEAWFPLEKDYGKTGFGNMPSMAAHPSIAAKVLKVLSDSL